MNSLDKERELFNSFFSKASQTLNIGSYEAFETWLERAKLAKAEQKKLEVENESLKAQLEAKNNAIIFADECRQEWCEFAMRKNKALQEVKAQLAQYQSDDCVLVNKQMIRQLVNELDYAFSEHELLGLTDLIALRDGFSLSLDQKTTPKQIDDYVLMPKEPTDEICEAIARTANVCGGIANDIYEAMIEAQEQDND